MKTPTYFNATLIKPDGEPLCVEGTWTTIHEQRLDKLRDNPDGQLALDFLLGVAVEWLGDTPPGISLESFCLA